MCHLVSSIDFVNVLVNTFVFMYLLILYFIYLEVGDSLRIFCRWEEICVEIKSKVTNVLVSLTDGIGGL